MLSSSMCNSLMMTFNHRARTAMRAMQSALDALLSMYTEQEWQQSFSSLSKQVAKVGPSHRARLVALKFLPAHNPRGFALQQATAASMLHGLCNIPSKVRMPHLSLTFQSRMFIHCTTCRGVCISVLQLSCQDNQRHM